MTNNSSNNIKKPINTQRRMPAKNRAVPQKKPEARRPSPIYFAVLAATALLLLLSLLVTGVGALGIGIASLLDKNPNNGTDAQSFGKGKTFGTVLPSLSEVGTYMPTGTGTAITGINGEAAILVDAASGTVLASKNADTPIHPASMTKVMTLIVAAENAKNPNAKLQIEQEMLDKMDELGGSGAIMSSMTVVDKNGEATTIEGEGYQLSLEDTLYLINYASDTVACLMVAKHIAGSEEAFVDMMNAKAEAIGLNDTHFVNTTGLTETDKSHNKTTARDMAAIMAYALKNEVVKSIISATELFRPTLYTAKGKASSYRISTYASWFTDKDRFNGGTGGKQYAGKITVKGGKTGYEEYPEKTVSFATYGASKNGKEYICIAVSHVLNSERGWTGSSTWENNTQDIKYIYRNYVD